METYGDDAKHTQIEDKISQYSNITITSEVNHLILCHLVKLMQYSCPLAEFIHRC